MIIPSDTFEDVSMSCRPYGLQDFHRYLLFNHISNLWSFHRLLNFRICLAYIVILKLYRHPLYESSRKFFWCPVSLVVFRVFIVTCYLVTLVNRGSLCSATLVDSRASSLLII